MKTVNHNNTGTQRERDFVSAQAVEFRRTGIAFEFGTYHGYTTACLAEVCDHVYTIDLPDGGEGLRLEISAGKSLGHFYKFHKMENITQLLEDTMTFDPSTIPKCDVVVVDADHDYEHTRNDFTKGLVMLRKGGCLLVHDAQYHSVKRWLEDSGYNYKLIEGTRYAKILPTH